jgi:signal transduction histidine kinase
MTGWNMNSIAKYARTAVLLLCLLPGQGFAAGLARDTGAEAPMSAYEVSQKWLNMETELLNYVTAPPAAEKLLAALDDFSKSVDGFLQSPLYESGRLTAFSQTDTTGTIRPLIGELERAIRAGQTGAVLNFSEEIRKELARWLYLDSAMADTIHLKYFYQFIVLLTLIVIMSALVWRLTVSLEKARLKGKASAAFSRQVVLGQEQERSRIARELHDSVAQELSVLEMKVSQILYRVGSGDPSGEIQAICGGLSVGHTELIARIRTICNDLAPPEFRHQGLADALRKLCYDFEKTAGIECRITVPEGFSADPMPVQMQLQCFRLVQEALANIRKHAEAKEATVVLRNTTYGGRPALLICVSDDGKGFTPPQSAADTPFPGHFGIRGMYERIDMLGGNLSFISEEGEGTMVKIEAPLL